MIAICYIYSSKVVVKAENHFAGAEALGQLGRDMREYEYGNGVQRFDR